MHKRNTFHSWSLNELEGDPHTVADEIKKYVLMAAEAGWKSLQMELSLLDSGYNLTGFPPEEE